MPIIRSLCVYCGASPGHSAVYAEAAAKLAATMVAHGIDLVYGGGNIGLMGRIADEVMQRGGKVVGVIPKALLAREVGHHGLTELHVVNDMHQRKAMMADLSDGFIALPGGWGTLEELFEMLTWLQLGFHSKPIGLLNTNGFYDKLLDFISHQVDEGFLSAVQAKLILQDTVAESLIARILSAPEPSPPNPLPRDIAQDLLR